MNAQTLPEKLNITTAVASFMGSLFQHPTARETFKDLCTAVGASSSPQILIFTGPTGVGKTTIAKALTNKMLQYYSDQMLAEPDFVPVVTVSAVPPSGTGFSWKDFHVRVLAGQSEPLVDRKYLMPYQTSLLPAHSLSSKALDQSTADALRRSTEECLRRRKTKLLIIDEAQHMLLVGGQQRLECQFECLKSLTIETGVTILLVGTYRLLEILDQSGQLTRRSQVINFPRYDMRKKDDRNHFKQVLKHCEHELSKYVPTRLEEHADYFYTKSAGCIGILKDWLCRCLEYALQEKKPCLDAALAAHFAHSNRGLVTIIEEACLGEAKLADVDDAKLTDLLANGVLLGTGTPSARGKHRPGRRNPTRDPVGVSA